MNQNLKEQKLSKNEELWLNEVYQLFLKNELEPDIKTIKRKLISDLDSNFNPKKINTFLLRYGNKITPFGVRYFDKNTDYLPEIDFLLKTIKGLLSDNDIKKIRVKELSKITSLSIKKISQLLHLISSFHSSNFWCGSSHELNGKGYISIDVDREDVRDEYIAYTNIDEFLKKENMFGRVLKSELHNSINKNKPNQTYKHLQFFVDPERIQELKEIKNEEYDLTKLIQLCGELNLANENESYFSVIFLIRSILDHILPIFNESNFSEVANSFKRSRKHIFLKLEDSSKQIAHMHLHSHISQKEMLPNLNQTNFMAEADFQTVYLFIG
jgi:hypothetical protein